MTIKIILAGRNGTNRWGSRKYTWIPSRTRKGLKHYVAKIRKRYTRNYRYICTCEDFVNRQSPCWHIKLFKKLEKPVSRQRKWQIVRQAYNLCVICGQNPIDFSAKGYQKCSKCLKKERKFRKVYRKVWSRNHPNYQKEYQLSRR